MTTRIALTLVSAGLAIGACHDSSPSEGQVRGPAGKLHVDDGGAGAIPVVFVHGFAGSTKQWADQLAYLRPTTRAVALDLRGHGKSDRPKDLDYSIAGFARDIDAVADELDLDRFVLVGHSMGGAAALEYARTRPDRVAGVVLVAAPGKSPPELIRKVVSAMTTDYDKTSGEFWDRLLTNARPEVARQIKRDRKRVQRDEALAIITSVFAYDPTPALRAYKGPMLIIDPQDSSGGPGALPELAPTVPRIVVLGTSHWPQMDKPGDVNAALDVFLEQVRRSGLQATPQP